MSQTQTHEVRCRCGATVSVFCADSINAERHPHMRDAILSRTLHVFRCGACGGSLTVDKALLYVDLARRELYGVHPPSEWASEREHGEALIATWSSAVGDTAGAAARTLFDGDRFHVRLCYGLEELREKIALHDAGLRDLPLEALKAETLAGSDELRKLSVVALRLDGVRPGGDLVLLAERPTDPPTLLDLGLVVDRARYDALAALPWQDLLARFPGIAAGPHVSMLRWTLS
ncbi:MAG TPA: CpXC domain-containing protein [Kofleriaceae bacterium]